MDLRPTERSHLAVDVVDAESSRVEPLFALTLAERLERPTALLPMARKCTVVDRQPTVVVDTWNKITSCRRDSDTGGQRAAHLMERAPDTHTGVASKLAVHRRGFVNPPVDVPAPVGSDDLDGGVDQLRADRGHLVSVVRMDHQLERVGVVTPRHLGVRNRMIVAWLRCKQPGEPVVAAIDEVEVEVIGQRPPSIGARCSVEQLVHRGDVIIFHLTFDLKTSHGARLPVQLPALLPGRSRPVGPSARRGVRSFLQTRFPPTCLPRVSGIRRLTSPNDGPFRGVVVSFSADLANGALQGALGGAKLALRFVDCPDDVVALGTDERLGETSYPFAVAADVVGNGREFRRRAFE